MQITKIESLGIRRVINLSVKRNHTFITASGIPTHNCDAMPTPIQLALRAFIEDASSNCSFILTCNYKNRIIDALHSRCQVIDFVIAPEDKPSIMGQMLKRSMFILTNEGIVADRKDVANLIQTYCPDWRRLIGELQRHSASGKISVDVKDSRSDAALLIEKMRLKNFADIRKWVFGNPTVDLAVLVRELDEALYDVVTPASIPQAVLIFADYQHKHTTAMDPSINILAMMVELMGSIEFR